MWVKAIEEGRVGAHLSAFLGGGVEKSDLATVRVAFLNANGQSLGDVLLPTVGPRERDGKTGLFPVESNNMVPAGTAIIRVDLTFSNVDLTFSNREGSSHSAFADNLELILTEFSQ